MTLPFSDKPEKSSIYQDVKTETLQELTPDQFDTFRARMFAEGVNGLEDEYRRLLLLGLAADKLSVSGPLPGTSFNIQGSITDSGEGNGIALFTPSAGEVWQLNAISYADDTTGSPIIYVGLKDQNNGLIAYALIDTIGGGPWVPDDEFGKPLLVDENQALFVYAFVSGGFDPGTSADITANFIRVR